MPLKTHCFIRKTQSLWLIASANLQLSKISRSSFTKINTMTLKLTSQPHFRAWCVGGGGGGITRRGNCGRYRINKQSTEMLTLTLTTMQSLKEHPFVSSLCHFWKGGLYWLPSSLLPIDLRRYSCKFCLNMWQLHEWQKSWYSCIRKSWGCSLTARLSAILRAS
jgi:hypothetical protein